jgi:hypothetical protein
MNRRNEITKSVHILFHVELILIYRPLGRLEGIMWSWLERQRLHTLSTHMEPTELRSKFCLLGHVPMKRSIRAFLLSQGRGLLYEAYNEFLLGLPNTRNLALEPVNATEHVLGVLQNTLVMVLVQIWTTIMKRIMEYKSNFLGKTIIRRGNILYNMFFHFQSLYNTLYMFLAADRFEHVLTGPCAMLARLISASSAHGLDTFMWTLADADYKIGKSLWCMDTSDSLLSVFWKF